MTLFHILLVALVQGITEFLPISSSGHLILLPALTSLPDQGQIIDVAVHVGSLGAVMLYFRRDILFALSGVPRLLTGNLDTKAAWFALCLMVATVPVVVIGLALKVTGLDDAMRSVAVIGWTMILFGILLYVVDRRSPSLHKAENWKLRDAVVMGLWQAVALIPGTSRSGITITAARMLDYRRSDAARLSMVMSVPTIIASGVLSALTLASSPNPGQWHDGALAAVFSFVAALLALTLMMRLLRVVSFTPYVIYRIVLGVVLLYLAYAQPGLVTI